MPQLLGRRVLWSLSLEGRGIPTASSLGMVSGLEECEELWRKEEEACTVSTVYETMCTTLLLGPPFPYPIYSCRTQPLSIAISIRYGCPSLWKWFILW